MFREDFAWGVASAAYQIEGAAHEDGRGLSIWDVYTEAGNCVNQETGDIACDHYHRFEEDVKWMKQLGVKVYRFSLSWTRILPHGVGEINQKGIDFYNRLIDCLLDNGITPYITLFHWDYPYELEIRGNWSNPESSDWFVEYARIVFDAFGDRVKHFITFNEPQCFIACGYGSGIHAPGLKCSNRDLILKTHNVLLAHGKTVRLFREMIPDGKIGYAPTRAVSLPASDSKEDIEAARRSYFDAPADEWAGCVSWWSDPILLGHYPEETEAFCLYAKYLPETYKEDLKIISEPIDFYCQNIYEGYPVKKAETERGYKRINYPTGSPKNALNWSVTPTSLYWGPKFLYERYGLPIIISENGMPCHDVISTDGKVHDPNRIHYMQQYLSELNRAIDEGIDIRGYMYWSLMDNLEWNLGYTPRFGLLYIDYKTLERIPKDSFYWYKETIEKNGKNL